MILNKLQDTKNNSQECYNIKFTACYFDFEDNADADEYYC